MTWRLIAGRYLALARCYGIATARIVGIGQLHMTRTVATLIQVCSNAGQHGMLQ